MFKIFQDFPFLIAEVSEKEDGNMRIFGKNLGNETEKEISLKNRQKFFQKNGIKPSEAVSPLLSHGSKILFVGKNETGKFIEGFDGFIAKEKRVFLTVTVADCLPIFFFDPKTRLFGLVHAGWKGIFAGILESAVLLMKKNGAEAENILVGIGPCISACHFEVKDDLLSNFRNYLEIPGVLNIAGEKSFLDLKEIAKIKLVQVGLLGKNIEINPECSFCETDCESEKYFSFRRDGENNFKTMIAIMGIRY